MNDLFEQYLAEVTPFVRPEKLEEFKQTQLWNIEAYGEVNHIEDVYSKDGKDLMKRRYNCSIYAGFVLDALRIGLENLNHLIEDVPPEFLKYDDGTYALKKDVRDAAIKYFKERWAELKKLMNSKNGVVK
jgi:hypothetical protein